MVQLKLEVRAVGSSYLSLQSWYIEKRCQISKTGSRFDYNCCLWSLKLFVISSLASWSSDLFSRKQKWFFSEHFIIGGIVECPRKGKMGPIIMKFLLGLNVYMTMPKPPAVTIADLSKALFPNCPIAGGGNSSRLD